MEISVGNPDSHMTSSDNKLLLNIKPQTEQDLGNKQQYALQVCVPAIHNVCVTAAVTDLHTQGGDRVTF